MEKSQPVKGFSKLSRSQKTELISGLIDDPSLEKTLSSFRIPDPGLQEIFESFSENTISNYHLPWGIVPNVFIDGKLYHVPVVIEESSVVAAASKAAGFWAARGGFQTVSLSTIKKGQLHFIYPGSDTAIKENWSAVSKELKLAASHLTINMEKRGGGITGIHLKTIEGLPAGYYQLDLEAETADSMGANFINSVLEEMGRNLPVLLEKHTGVQGTDILMAILSNYTPESIITMKVEAPVQDMQWTSGMDPVRFCERMKWAADIAWHDPGRAVTHNKGIYNGVDAVVLATGNDFRAVEAAGHAFAARDGKYRALSRLELSDQVFSLSLTLPLALGTVGGLTSLHPLAAKTLEILGNPSAAQLMKIAAALGIANNFAAMASLVTTGIQQGHMKMHLQNIINSLQVKKEYHGKIEEYFRDKTVSVASVREFLSTLQ